MNYFNFEIKPLCRFSIMAIIECKANLNYINLKIVKYLYKSKRIDWEVKTIFVRFKKDINFNYLC